MPRNSGSLRDALLLQRREIDLRFQEPFVVRDIEASRHGGHLIQVILGPRRAGKSLLALHLARGLGPFGYVNFDDEVLYAVEDQHALISAVDAL